MTISDACSMEQISFDSLSDIFLKSPGELMLSCPFVHPSWMKAWWNNFNENRSLRLLKCEKGGRLVGIAPLMRGPDGLGFVGSPDLCDYCDVMVARGEEGFFFRELFRHVERTEPGKIVLGPSRDDSLVFRFARQAAEQEGFEVSTSRAGVSYETDLEGGWEDFLQKLSGKQRHEVRRKIRRLEEAGDISFHCLSDEHAVAKGMAVFFRLFQSYRSDKASFMTRRRASFFMDLARETAKAGMARLFFLRTDGKTAATAFCFDWKGTRHLYNNGYDDRYRNLSVGALCKVFSIRDAIESGLKAYSFLKGDEPYKSRLGGRPVELWELEINPKR